MVVEAFVIVIIAIGIVALETTFVIKMVIAIVTIVDK